MKNLRRKRFIITLMLIALVVLVIIFGYSVHKQHTIYHDQIFFNQGAAGYLFLISLFALLLLLIFFFLVTLRIKRKENNSVEVLKKDKNDNSIVDYFYVDIKPLVDLDERYIQSVKENETIVEYVQSEEEKKDYYDIALEEMNKNNESNQTSYDIKGNTNKHSAIDSYVVPTNGDKKEEKKSNVEIEENNQDTSLISETGESRFYNLTQIDRFYETYKPPRYNNDISLHEICDMFRDFACRNLRLFYDIEDIRRFIGGLSVTKLIILQGMSGTGKTSLAYAFGEFLDNTTSIIPVQPMWKERTDLVGYYNEFTKKFNETSLLYKMYEANYNDEIYITVLDEMNIARIEYYFAEFLSLLEIPNLDGRNLDVVPSVWANDPKKLSDKGQIKLPRNMWFIGTANNDDSTFAISDKVYDRAMVLNLDKKAKTFDAPKTDKLKLSCTHLTDLFREAQKEFEISDRNLRRIKKLDEYMIKNFHLTFGNRIMKQIQSYVPVLVSCGGSEVEAIDDILSRKVFRKLESKNPVYVRQMADNICAYLDELFGNDRLPLCKEAIRLIEQNI